MPRRKIHQPQPAEDTRYNKLDESVSERANELRTRAAPQYDGVLGTLDSWLPKNFEEEFEAARNRLLDGGYTAEQVRDLMAQEIRRYRIAVRNPLNPISYGGFPCPPKVRDAVLSLARIKTAVRLGPEKGLAFLTDQSHANKVQKGERYGQVQSLKAKLPRGKIDGTNGKTVNQMIGRLALKNDGVPAKDLWEHFISMLDEEILNPERDARDIAITYDFNGKRKTITYGTFEKVVSQYRKGRRKLP